MIVRWLRNSLVVASLATAALGSALPAAAAPPRSAPDATASRGITFNGRPATAHDLQVLARFERAWGVQIPAGAYWYDNASGAAGLWGGPTRGFLGAGLGLGGTMPATASGGGSGMITGVFINGRELHPLDVQGLTQMFGQPPWPGQWWVDGLGNFGARGGPALGNLIQLAEQRNRRGGGNSYYKSDVGTGKSTFVGSGCAAVHARKNPSSSTSDTYSYYVGCE